MEVMEKCVSILLLIFFKVFFKKKRVISKNTLAQPSTPSGLSMISGALCIMGAWYLTRTETYHPYQDAGGKFNEKALDFGYIYDSSNKRVIMG